MNFTPVLDVLSNTENTALGTRAFSEDPQLVASLGRAFIQGELRGGIIPVAKHFPGQGGTAGDSHYGLPTLDSSREQLDARELIPFRGAIAAGLPAVMTAHITLPRVAESSTTPATLSHRLLTDVLRHDLRFRGLVITDELQMRAVQGQRKIGDVAVDALLAGADMLMVVWDHRDREEIYATLNAAYASGRLPRAVVDRAVRHILAAKRRLAGMPPLNARLHDEPSRLVERIAAQAVTADAPNGFHLGAEPIVFVGPDGALRQRFARDRWIPTPPRVDRDILQQSLKIAAGAKTIVAAIASENDQGLVVYLRRALPDARFILVCLGAPQLLRGINSPEAIIYAYSDLPSFQAAAGRVLDGMLARGLLPVSSPISAKRH